MKEQLKKLAGELPKIAPPWPRILEVLISLRNILQQSEKNSISTNVVIIRNTLSRIENLLPSIISSSPALQSDINEYWKSFTKWLLEIVDSFAQGNFRGNFEVDDNFDNTISSLMQDLYNVDDCLDGLEFIISCSKENLDRHSLIFKETYQLSLSYINDLVIALNKLFEFPFHQLMDVKLSDLPYQFSKNHLRTVLEVFKVPSSNIITNPHLALKQYEILLVELNKLHQFINEFKSQLKKVYFSKTDINLLTLSPKLYKRHLVLSLFSN
jgi:hypothetical protein